MGSSKKKKEKAKDFAKAKLKLGKGKQKAANATDASYASKTISLGKQSIGREANQNAPSTKRNLTLSDLLTQLKHYNASVRKDALLGIRELLVDYSDVFDASVSTVVPALARLIGDEEASVRKALLSMLSWYLPIIPHLVLRPYQEILVSFTLSALSHIYPDVRMDALRVLHTLLDVMPTDLALPWLGVASSGNSTFGERILEHCLSLLHVRSGITNTGLRTDISTASKALILSTLEKLVTGSIVPSVNDKNHGTASLPPLPMWQFRRQLRSQRALAAFEQRCGATVQQRNVPASVNPGAGSGGSFMDVESTFGLEVLKKAENALLPSPCVLFDPSAFDSPSHLLQQLLPLLTAAFLDTAPTAFAPASAIASTSSNTSIDAAGKTALSVIKIVVHLLQAQMNTTNITDALALTSPVIQQLLKLLSHTSVYFPLSVEFTQYDKSAANVRKELNITFCEFAAYFALITKPTSLRNGKTDAKTQLSHHLQVTRRYLREICGVQDARIGQGTETYLDAHIYARIVPVFGILLDTSGDAEAHELWQSMILHFKSCSSGSLLKKVAFRAVSIILEAQLQPEYIGNFFAFDSVDHQEDACSTWYAALPRYIWELGDKDPVTAALILRHLHMSLLAGSVQPDEVSLLARHMEPYFCSIHPVKGEVYGPFTRCTDVSVQEAALRLVNALRGIRNAETSALASAAEKAVRRVSDEKISGEWCRIASSVVYV